MKKIITILTIMLLAHTAYSQQLVQNINDIYRLKDNEVQFINRPLKDLLKEIRPEIKIAFPYDNPTFFDFRFITSEQLQRDEGTVNENVALFVYVKDFINWKWKDRPKGKEPNWTKEDAEKYGNLIVTRISIVY